MGKYKKGDKVFFENEHYTVQVVKENKVLIEPIFESKNDIIKPSWEEVNASDLK